MNTSAATHQSNNLSVFLLGAILNILAVLDYNSLMDYSAKAIVGGMIWLAFKVLGEHLATRIKKKTNSKEESGDEQVAKVRISKRRSIGIRHRRRVRNERE